MSGSRRALTLFRKPHGESSLEEENISVSAAAGERNKQHGRMS